MINRYGKSDASQDAKSFYLTAKALINSNPEASPCICYNYRNFMLMQHAWERKQYPAAECIFNRESLLELINDYPPQTAIFIISETLEYIMLEKCIFNA